MPELQIIMGGYSINTDQTRLGLCTVTLIRGDTLSIVDVAHFGRRNLLVDQLAAQNISPNDIGRVILTHAHWDHSQNTDLFPNAEIVIHAAELEYSKNPRAGDLATARYFANTLLEQNVRPVTAETELEPGVRIIETPGHTRGHISVIAETAAGPVCIGGDAMSDAGAVARGTPAIIFCTGSIGLAPRRWGVECSVQDEQAVSRVHGTRGRGRIRRPVATACTRRFRV